MRGLNVFATCKAINVSATHTKCVSVRRISLRTSALTGTYSVTLTLPRVRTLLAI